MPESVIEAKLRDARKVAAEYERVHEQLERELRKLEAAHVPLAEALGTVATLDEEFTQARMVLEMAAGPTPMHIPAPLPCGCKCR
jgi:hypothetical protein